MNTRLHHSSSRHTDTQGAVLEPIDHRHNAPLAALIRAVSAEYGLTADKGFSVADPNLDTLSLQYDADNAGYWVLEDTRGNLLGGAGFGPVAGYSDVCELQKMYLTASARGKGWGYQLALKVITVAQLQGYRRCYLETTRFLPEALALYQRLGFKPCARLGNTGHNDCEITLMLPLVEEAYSSK
ncbi:GNAT family N-acetyltransferase [Oceanisphaera sp.]|uniref:GNAT family N-acetyltransferase n=1 Tax=Oceanisphaera sp. TaxID=1929979 RepID=UPI003A8E56E9